MVFIMSRYPEYDIKLLIYTYFLRSLLNVVNNSSNWLK
nr:MAG TPA: hypothetical protein [Bacteriophage sp.]